MYFIGVMRMKMSNFVLTERCPVAATFSQLVREWCSFKQGIWPTFRLW